MKREAYASFERTIVDLYERRALTLHRLDAIARKYRLSEIDSAGSLFLLAHDGKDLHQICISLVDPSFPLAVRGSSTDNEEAWERELQQWETIVRDRWGWRDYCNPFPASVLQEEAA